MESFEAILSGSLDVPNPPCSMWIQGSSSSVSCLVVCLRSCSKLFDMCMRMCVNKRPIAQPRLRFTPGHYHHRAWKGKLGNLHAQTRHRQTMGAWELEPHQSLFSVCFTGSGWIQREQRWDRRRREWVTWHARRRGETRWHLFMKIEQKDGEGICEKGESRQEEIWGHLRMKKDNKDKRRKRRDVRKDRWLDSKDR